MSRFSRSALVLLASAWLPFLPSLAQSSQPSTTEVLTLAQAEASALAKQPRMLAAQLRARASAERIKEARSGYLPTVNFNATGVRVADAGTSLAAGYITTSAVSDRFAYGGNLSQLVTDFGRTSALVGAARSTAQAQADVATLTRAQVRLNVREAYYEVLGAEAVLRAAKAAQANRHLVAQQLSALAQSELRSTLDVNFANVLASEADLAVVQAESVVSQQRARLATATGSEKPVTAALAEPVGPDALPPDPGVMLPGAQAQRADL
ncbi:MAG TPA: TolC family protein, partial [Acidobacteriaceae bacterium]|nr:TolC family protein [Acidobacteriaceae bacterium]